MNKAKLEQYCKDHKIFVPSGATVEYLNAAIVRAYRNGHGEEIKNLKFCFGYWENEDSNCQTCDFEKLCKRSSLGMDPDEYAKKLASAENPKLRFKTNLREPRFSRPSRKR